MDNAKELVECSECGEVVIDVFHRHEIIDRISVVMDTLDTHIIQHSFCDANPKVKKRLAKAFKHLFVAYQQAANTEVMGG